MARAFPARLFSAARPNPDAPAAKATETSKASLPIGMPDARSEDRLPVSAGAMLVAHQTELQPVSIADLSRHGCCLVGDCDALRPGQFISIKIGKMDRLAAIVRWSNDGRAGVEFTRGLPPDVFEYFMREFSPE
jgi:hypothetical protein